MIKRALGNTGLTVSRVGLGGHYKAMEEGSYEDRYAYVEAEVEARTALVARALAAGINYFDTTWRNEVAMLGATLARLGAREQAVVNGMVLGAFSGSRACGLSVEDYFNRWFDARLPLLPGGYFDTFMINAIEEGYNEADCERALGVLEKRRAAGDLRAFGFSCHSPELARQVCERFPAFQTAMVPYNFYNRRFESAFAGYSGPTALIAMKPLVWLEYGIPFCALNRLPDFAERFGFEPALDASALAYRFILSNPAVTCCISAVNNPEELEGLIQAGEGGFTEQDAGLLERYSAAARQDDSIPLYLGGLRHDNLRMNYFGAMHLARVLGRPMPEIPLNEPDSRARIQDFAAGLQDEVRARG